MKWKVFVLALFLIVELPRADERLIVEMPEVVLTPGRLLVRTVIEPDSDNRAVQVTAESLTFYRKSEIRLDGDSAARRNDFEFKSLPAGTYEIHVTLLDEHDAARASVVRSVQVKSHA